MKLKIPASKSTAFTLILAIAAFMVSFYFSHVRTQKEANITAADTTVKAPAPDQEKLIKTFYAFKISPEKFKEFLDDKTNIDYLVFKYFVPNLSRTDLTLDVTTFPVQLDGKSPAGGQYDLTQDVEWYKPEPNEVHIFGNNYLKIDSIRKYISELPKTTSFIKLHPQRGETVPTKVQFVYEIRAYDAQGDLIKHPQERKLLTDPSPPAPVPDKSPKTSKEPDNKP